MLVHKTRTTDRQARFKPQEHQEAVNVVLTSAGVGRSAAVETRSAGLAAPPPRVVHTLQTFAAAAVAASRHAGVDVAVTSAGPAGSAHAGAPRRVTVETLLTDVTAGT